MASREGGKLNELIRDFKSFTAKELLKSVENNQGESRGEWLLHLFKYFPKFQKQNAKYMSWQKTNHPIELWSSSVIDQKINYIENNPVEAGIVTEAEIDFYSSANRFGRLNITKA